VAPTFAGFGTLYAASSAGELVGGSRRRALDVDWRAFVSVKLCACGAPKARLTKKQIAAYNRLRGYDITLCPCGHEILVPKTAKDVRTLGAINGRWSHRECAYLARELARRGGQS
jgi:hypothetical protein